MDFAAVINDFVIQLMDIARVNPLISLAVVIILAFLAYRKPAFFFSILGLGLVLALASFFIFSISDPGVSSKNKALQKNLEPQDSFKLPGIKL